MKLALAMLAVAAWCTPMHAQIPAQQRMVIVISLDGFPAYALDDAKLPVPTLRRLIRQGVTARMGIINPTVTWPNHTALVTGVRADEHGLLVNGSLVPTGAWPPVKVDPMVDKVKMVHAPTVYDAAHKAGLTTAQIDWVAINNAPTITWPFNEWASPAGPVEQEMIRKGVISADDVQDFTKSNILFRDQIWTKAAVHLIREHRPNLMLLHFLSLDSSHHQFGPKSLAANAAMAFLDSCVEKVVAAVHETGMDDRTTFFVVADHGFKGYTKEIRPAIALAEAGTYRQGSRRARRRHGNDLCRIARCHSPGGEGARRPRRRRPGYRTGWLCRPRPSAARQGSSDESAPPHRQGRDIRSRARPAAP